MPSRMPNPVGEPRLDRFLAEHLALSRTQVRELLRLGHVRVDGRVQSASDKGRTLLPEHRVEVDAPASTLQTPVPAAHLSLRVLAEGEGWVAVDKPAGQAVHPLRSDQHDTLLNALLARYPHMEGVGEGGLRSGVVHRLDVDTSGVQVFALEPARWEALRGAFSGHRVDKVYRALVTGRLEVDGEIELPLRVSRHRPARVRVEEADDARSCGLRWRVLETFFDATLLELRPRTGFLHQIRVSCAHLGHSLLGDATYADGATAARAGRHLLHAARLAVDDVMAESPDAPDFAACLAALRRG